jgi:hypothetical protein
MRRVNVPQRAVLDPRAPAAQGPQRWRADRVVEGAVCGRLESRYRYRYSAAIVYNNFPWPLYAEGFEQTRRL